MPELLDQMYCSQQIVIPPKYPYILKRYCKAAIKTQPYDLLRWSFEYFRALAEHRPPPVKLRLEYPVYSTEGGLTRGCLKVLAHQLYGMKEIPTGVLKQAWQGFCLDRTELHRILCLCEVYCRRDSVPFFNFLAVAGGMLTKCLTHTMILLCESLTKEPDGGSAAIPVEEFLTMYRFLAPMDASKDIQYHNGFREGSGPSDDFESESPDNGSDHDGQASKMGSDHDDYWDGQDVQRLALIDDHVGRTAKISEKLNLPPIGKIERSPSIERMREIERDNYMRERIVKPAPSEEIDKKLKQLSTSMLQESGATKKGEPKPPAEPSPETPTAPTETKPEGDAKVQNEMEKVQRLIARVTCIREERIQDLEQVFDEIAAIVDKFKTANYDLGMIAGRQMSTTSGEFIVQYIEKEIMAYIDEQIAILPDPDLKKKKAKPEEVMMIREILEQFLDDNMDIIVPEIEEVEEEEAPIPEITMVYAVPGIGGPVCPEIMTDFEDYIKEVCKVQAEMVMPRNIRHFLCPPMEKYVEKDYGTRIMPEQIATGGTITD